MRDYNDILFFFICLSEYTEHCLYTVPLAVSYLTALLPKITSSTAELDVELLQFSHEALTIHSEPLLTAHELLQLFKGFSTLVRLFSVLLLSLTDRKFYSTFPAAK